MSRRRSRRSTSTPAKGDASTPGSTAAIEMIANCVAEPVVW